MGKFLRLVNGRPKLLDEGSSPAIYDEAVTVGVGGVGTGSPVTLPSNRTYDSLELEVYLNGQRLDDVVDYNYVGIAPRTQVSFTFDLVEGDLVRFRIDRSA